MGDSAIRYERYDTDCHKFFVYVLKLENGWYYVGQTKIICERILDHFSGRGSVITSKYPPRKIIHIGIYPTRGEAIKRETELKNFYYVGSRGIRGMRVSGWKKKK